MYRQRTWACRGCGQFQVRRPRRYCQLCVNAHQRYVVTPPTDDPLWHTPEHEQRVAQLEALRKGT